MRFLFLSLFSMSAAHAATIQVPNQVSTIAQAVAQAAAGDTILLTQPDPFFVHVISDTILVDKNLTIRAANPPREIYDQDIEDDVLVWIDLDAATAAPGFRGAFEVRRDVHLTFENLYFKLQETLCDDRLDNDGNGLVDKDDPFCSDTQLDTSISPSISGVGVFTNDVRAFYVRPDGRLTVRGSIFQGFSMGVEGNVIYASDADRVTIENSQFVNNLGLLEVVATGGYTRSRGIVYAKGTTLEISETYFEKNHQRFGGAVFATDGSVVLIEDSEFHLNSAEDGGAIYVESSTLFAERNFFSANTATLVPSERLYAEYEGAAIYAEDSAIEIKNNVFLQNETFDWGSSILVRRSFGGSSPPLIENNTFVENVAQLDGGASVMVDDTSLQYVNNISYREGNGVLGAQNWILGTIPTVKYNNFYGVLLTDIFTADLSGVAIEQVTNIFTDPLFTNYADAAHDDWRLWRFWLDPLSPAIDAGDPTIFDVGGSRSDMGAYGGNNTGALDADGDGWTNIYDCDDNDPTVQPYAFEACDDMDNDCNGIVDDREVTYYLDRDIDGYGTTNPADQITACPEDNVPTPPQGIWVTLPGDCNDTNTLVNPGRSEFCDGLDNDCNGTADDNIPLRTHYLDRDLDGFGDPDPRYTIVVQCPPEGYSPFSTDCNDNDATIHPLVTTATRSHLPLANAPIERHEADRNPAYVADGIDQDCDAVDLCFPDFDSDGFGAAPEPGQEPTYIVDNDRNCRNLSSFTAVNNLDCDDGDPNSYPGGTEIPGDGLDQNCDGKEECYEDLDGDGYGTETLAFDNDLDCDNGSVPSASNSDDCDDNVATGAAINPLAIEECDGFDNDCDGVIDEVTSPDASTFYLDADGDGFGDIENDIRACGTPLGYSKVGGDCDDNEPRAYPGNDEFCDGIDNNCEAGIDEDEAIDVANWYEDLDGDGYGNRDLVDQGCAQPEEGGPWIKAGKPFDCNDAEPTVGPCPDCGCSNLGADGSLPFLLSLLSIGLVRRRRSA